VSDPRLLRWIELTREFLRRSAPEKIEQLQTMFDERARLMRDLAARPAASATPPDLARALQDCEAMLDRTLAELRTDLGQRIDTLRGARQAAKGYRPIIAGHPAFVSRSV